MNYDYYIQSAEVIESQVFHLYNDSLYCIDVPEMPSLILRAEALIHDYSSSSPLLRDLIVLKDECLKRETTFAFSKRQLLCIITEFRLFVLGAKKATLGDGYITPEMINDKLNYIINLLGEK